VSSQRQVSVAELKRAWRAVQDGAFQDQPQPYAAEPGLVETLRPVGGRVIPVLGCGGGIGASTTALALALAIDAPCRLIDGAPPAASGLAGASTAELGERVTGWTHGTREQVTIERATEPVGPSGVVPVPHPGDQDFAAVVIDLACPPETLLSRASWLRDVVLGGDALVLVTAATVPGMRRLESSLTLLAQHQGPSQTVAAALGARRSRWPKPVRHGLGPRGRRLEQDRRTVVLPYDRHLAVSGLDTTALPAPLLVAAAAVLELLPLPKASRLSAPATKGCTTP
jgi:hypothetical protein